MTVMREVRRAAFEQHSVRVVFLGERGHVCKMGGNVGTASKSSCTVTECHTLSLEHMLCNGCPWSVFRNYGMLTTRGADVEMAGTTFRILVDGNGGWWLRCSGGCFHV